MEDSMINCWQELERIMIEFDYLYRGVCGLANAHRAGVLSGHLGAAVVAGYFFGEDHTELPEEVCRGVEGELDRIIQGEEAIWFNARKAGLTPSDLFKKFPQQPAQEKPVESLAQALNRNVAKTRQSGHNVIFATIAMRALSDHPEYATPQIVAGIRKLIAGFDNAHAGRAYFGKEKGWLTEKEISLENAQPLPKYQSITQMAETMISTLISEATVRRQGFGGLWHLINHAAGIVELDNLGFEELALKALPAHHHHLQLWLFLPNLVSELGPVVKAEHHPFEPVYWKGMLKRDEARLTHRIKTMYGFYTLLKYLDDDSKIRQAEDAFLYLMA